MAKPSESKYSIKYVYNDSGGFRFTTKMLEDICSESKKVNKQPKLVIAINRNDKELFIIDGLIKIEKK